MTSHIALLLHILCGWQTSLTANLFWRHAQSLQHGRSIKKYAGRADMCSVTGRKKIPRHIPCTIKQWIPHFVRLLFIHIYLSGKREGSDEKKKWCDLFLAVVLFFTGCGGKEGGNGKTGNLADGSEEEEPYDIELTEEVMDLPLQEGGSSVPTGKRLTGCIRKGR